MRNRLCIFGLGIIICSFCTLFTSMTALASEKKMGIEIADSYPQAVFYFDFEEAGEYDISIVQPDGSTNVQSVNSIKASVTLSDVAQGTYQVCIIGDGDINVKARVECQSGVLVDSANEINVSSSLSGLKMWFDNGVFKASWDDTNIGAVNITLTNPLTMQVIASERINDTSYSKEISEDISVLEAFFVPSASSRINGAGNRYTIEVVRDVDGRGIYPTSELFNESIYRYTVNVGDNVAVKVFADDVLCYEEYFSQGGSYDIEIPLNAMDNHIVTEFLDKNGNLISEEKYIQKDIVAPKFSMNEVAEITNKESVLLSGRVTEVKKIWINDYEVETDSAGYFSFDYSVQIGDTEVVLRACDEAGNESQMSYLITRKKKSKLPIILFVVICVIGAVLFKRRLTPAKKMEIESNDKAEDKKKKRIGFDSFPKRNRVKKEAVSKKGIIEKPKKVTKSKSNPAERKSIGIDLIGNLSVIATLFIVGYIVLTKCLMITEVMSESMEPTLMTGSIVVYNKLAYSVHDIERGDIVSFNFAETGEVYSKRVLGIAGDDICFRDGFIIINGEIASEEYIDYEVETNSAKDFVVPDGYIFVLGDNRNHSYDSRFWESPYICKDDVLGKYIGQIDLSFMH